MAQIPVMGFAAWSGTGKTTVLEAVVRELKKRGLRLAVIKHDVHGLDPEGPGKDSWRYRQAGADAVILAGPEEHRSLPELVQSVREADLILVEGFKNEPVPRIGLARKATGKGFTAPTDTFAAVITDEEIETKCPRFSFEDTVGIAEFIMEQTKDFTHFNDQGRAKMVDVGEKDVTRRTAVAAGRVLVSRDTFERIRSGGMKKGDVLTVAQIAGIMGAKRTAELIPMCHPVAVDGIDLSLGLDEERCSVEIEATVSCAGRTGVEMEALTAVSTAALTVYDMCKAVQKDMVITDIRLLQKTGGVHGDFQRKED